jgi:hypothetical protein
MHEPWDGLPDPWEGDHNIEYWVWHEDRLVPAPPKEVVCIQEEERTRDAMWRLEQMHERERREARSLKRRLSSIRVWHVGGMPAVVQWLRYRRRHGQAAHAEGARAERSSAR